MAVRTKLRICPACEGHRIEKVVYNHMVLDQTCSTCDGEGVLVCLESRADPVGLTHVHSVQSA
jgi:DnaJ-class molecular chaperone